jgi:hypothetical protein
METTIFASNAASGLIKRMNSNNTECALQHMMKLDKTKTKLACEKCGYSFEVSTLK